MGVSCLCAPKYLTAAYVYRMYSILVRGKEEEEEEKKKEFYLYLSDRECKVSVALNGGLLFPVATSHLFAVVVVRCRCGASAIHHEGRMRRKENENEYRTNVFLSLRFFFLLSYFGSSASIWARCCCTLLFTLSHFRLVHFCSVLYLLGGIEYLSSSSYRPLDNAHIYTPA